MNVELEAVVDQLSIIVAELSKDLALSRAAFNSSQEGALALREELDKLLSKSMNSNTYYSGEHETEFEFRDLSKAKAVKLAEG